MRTAYRIFTARGLAIQSNGNYFYSKTNQPGFCPHDCVLQPENAEHFDCWCSMITNDAGCTHKIKGGIAIAQAALNKKKALFTSELDLNWRKKKY